MEDEVKNLFLFLLLFLFSLSFIIIIIYYFCLEISVSAWSMSPDKMPAKLIYMNSISIILLYIYLLI